MIILFCRFLKTNFFFEMFGKFGDLAAATENMCEY